MIHDQDGIDVALVSMPWAPATEPCLGLSILKQCLINAGITTQVYHLAPSLLQWCSIETYTFLSELWAFNEFLFTGMLDGTLDEFQQHSFREQAATYRQMAPNPRYRTAEGLSDLALHMRRTITPRFIQYSLERVLERRPKLVGFTCSFDQTMASLALASRIRDVAPEIPIVFGGYALEGQPGQTVARAFRCVDLIVAGDGEEIIVDLARDIIAARGIKGRDGSKIVKASPVRLEKSPVPDFDDWFDAVERLSAESKIQINTKTLPVEGSRGCWWGQRQHCVFCGIDEETLKYRHKEAGTVFAMLVGLRERYGDYIFRFSDYIMPKEFYTELLPELARQPRRFRLHSEIKANHPPSRVSALARAGFGDLQPGIESFSTAVLKRMQKGVTAIQNVSLLKAGYLNEVIVNYNVLFGLPGDNPHEYREMLGLVPMLYHLIPPVTCTDTAITRFAPLEADPQRFGFPTPHRHHERYDILFSRQFLERTTFSLNSYAYYFARSVGYTDELETLYRQLCHQVDNWKLLHRERFVELSYEVVENRLSIVDSRFSRARRYFLSANAAEVYRACDKEPVGLLRIKSMLANQGNALGEAAFAQALEELSENRLIWAEGNMLFGLAVPNPIALERKSRDWCKSWESIWR